LADNTGGGLLVRESIFRNESVRESIFRNESVQH